MSLSEAEPSLDGDFYRRFELTQEERDYVRSRTDDQMAEQFFDVPDIEDDPFFVVKSEQYQASGTEISAEEWKPYFGDIRRRLSSTATGVKCMSYDTKITEARAAQGKDLSDEAVGAIMDEVGISVEQIALMNDFDHILGTRTARQPGISRRIWLDTGVITCLSAIITDLERLTMLGQTSIYTNHPNNRIKLADHAQATYEIASIYINDLRHEIDAIQ